MTSQEVLLVMGLIIAALVTKLWVDRVKGSPQMVEKELQEIVAEGRHTKEMGNEILAYFLEIADSLEAGEETYQDSQLKTAQHLIDTFGPNPMYYATMIAGNLARAIALEINGTSTNIFSDIKAPATARIVIQKTAII